MYYLLRRGVGVGKSLGCGVQSLGEGVKSLGVGVNYLGPFELI